MRFEGQTAIVTGAARGIGEAIARRLASEGAAVMIADVDDASAEATAAAIGELRGRPATRRDRACLLGRRGPRRT